MKKVLLFLSTTFVLIFIVQSCYYDKEDDLYPFPKTTCDTSNVTYSQSIVPIMAANCNNCHNKTNAGGGVMTDTWDKLNIVAKDERLRNAVNWTGAVNKNMPQGSSKLSDCDLSMINTWINAGSPNN